MRQGQFETGDLISLLNRLSGDLRPAYGARAADAGNFPVTYDEQAYGKDRYMVGTGSACCTFNAMGCGCSCARRRVWWPWSYRGGYPGQSFAMVDTDWPGIDWRNGVGHGPYVEPIEVFPMRGRANLVPFRGGR